MRRPFTITCLREQLEPRRHFTAHVTCDGETLHVDDVDGSWIATLRDGSRRHVLPPAAAELQARAYGRRKRPLRPSGAPAGTDTAPRPPRPSTRLPAQLDLDGRPHEIAPQHERVRLFEPVATSRGQLSMGAIS